MAAEPLHLQDALAVVHGHASPLPASEVPLTEAVGHVLAADAVSALDLPPFANSAMDGFAVRASDCSGATPEAPVVLKLSGESRAGQPAQIALEGGCAMPISTGAVMPLGGDAVLRVEDAVIADGQLSITQSLPTGHDVRPAGDDISSGQTV
ncbi:MAG: hypothetical protein JHC87_10135, partial [Thermoleophilaceae bacterium]|nr:hypothetical protein [Thermoleophilaceae bacterium]